MSDVRPAIVFGGVSVDDAFGRRVQAHRHQLVAANEESEARRQRCLAMCRQTADFSAAFLREMQRRGVPPPAHWKKVSPAPVARQAQTVDQRGALGKLVRRKRAVDEEPVCRDEVVVRGWIVLHAWSTGGGDSETRTAAAAPDATTAKAALVLSEGGDWFMGSIEPGSGNLWPAELEVYGARVRWKSDAIGAFFDRRDLFADWNLLKYLSELACDPTDALAQIAATSPEAGSQ